MQITTELGTISISNEALAMVAGGAATSCFGVKGMTVTSVKDGLVHLLKREYMTKGVRIRQNEDESVTVELHIAMDHGVNIAAAAQAIIHEVQYNVEKYSGVRVASVDVCVETLK